MKNILFVAVLIAASVARGGEVRQAILAGTWYKADPTELARDIDSFLARAGRTAGGAPIALIAPHAGHRYSGGVAGYAYRTILDRNFKRVILIAPCHRYNLFGASILNVTHYETPLGRVELDRNVCRALLGEKNFRTVREAHANEHSIEIHLPFLQRTLKQFKLVPILIGGGSREILRSVADSIAKHLDEDTILIASSDFVHYGVSFSFTPFRDNIERNIKKLDMGAVDLILKGDAGGFYDYKQSTGATICGWRPIYVLLNAVPGVGGLLQYDTSGRMGGDFSNSVSYVSAAFFSGAEKQKKPAKNAGLEGEKFLNDAEERALIEISRKVLESYVRTGKKPVIDPKGRDITDAMRAARGVFVTLEIGGRLRGCIGYITGVKPVFEAVVDNTISSSRDSRFSPVRPDELDSIDISISVMSELMPVKDPSMIKVGRDGLIIKKWMRHGVLLPQVPVELGWTREEFLAGICRKAGLPRDAWKEGAQIERFTAQVFHEK